VRPARFTFENGFQPMPVGRQLAKRLELRGMLGCEAAKSQRLHHRGHSGRPLPSTFNTPEKVKQRVQDAPPQP
jgi:hypothetical protein